jgi:CRISPR/Cas system-associated exonuclease Cas4 (RecB family)
MGYHSDMKITSSHFEAFLKCPTKCWLRFSCEPPAGNPYAEWVQSRRRRKRPSAFFISPSSLLEGAAKLKEPNTKDESFAVVVKSAQAAAVLVLVY